MPISIYRPLPLFDNLKHLKEQTYSVDPTDNTLLFAERDFDIIRNFLIQYTGSQDTFNVYRRELERLAQWSWFMIKKSILDLNRSDIESFVYFCLLCLLLSTLYTTFVYFVYFVYDR